MSSRPESSATTPPGRYQVKHYQNTRHFALYDGEKLLTVTVYKKGAESVQRELEARDAVIAEQAAQIEQLTAQASPPAPLTKRLQDRGGQGTNEPLGFFSQAEKARYAAPRRGSAHGRGA